MNTVQEIAKKWGISERRVRVLCAEGKIAGAYREGRKWRIPADSVKPSDARYKKSESLLPIIDEKIIALKNKRPLTQGELERLNEEFMVEFTYNSNAIEGNTLTLRETEMVLKGLTIDAKPLKDHLEVIGHKEAFKYVYTLVTEHADLTETVIKDIHYLVLSDKKDDRGIYRKVPVRIMGSEHLPTEPYLIVEQMHELIKNYNSDNTHIVTQLAKFHIDFERVHPFIDGNGRTGRLLVNLELMKAGLPPINIKFTDRLSYYQAFDDFHNTRKITSMENLFAKYVNEQLDRYLNIILA